MSSLWVGPAAALTFPALDQPRRYLRTKRGLVMLEDLHMEIFEPLVQSAFAVSDPEAGCVEMELVEVAGGAEDPRFEHFSLLFRGPLQPLLSQRIYTLEHPKIGAFQLFLVPVSQDANGTSYEAVFNRFKEGAGPAAG